LVRLYLVRFFFSSFGYSSLDKKKDGAPLSLFTNKADDVLGAMYIGMYNYYVLGYLNTNQTLKLINIPQIIIAKPKKQNQTFLNFK